MAQYRMVTYFLVYVGGRVFERTERPERVEELRELLPQFYPGAEITVEAHKERRYR